MPGISEGVDQLQTSRTGRAPNFLSAFTSEMGRSETVTLSSEENPKLRWISPRSGSTNPTAYRERAMLILDMGSPYGVTYTDLEGSANNGHVRCGALGSISGM